MATKSERQSLTVPRLVGQWLSGERLGIVRAVLVAASLGVAVLFGAGARRLYDQLLTPCPIGADCHRWMRDESSGVPAEFYARWTVGREIVFFAVFCALATLLFWKAPRQPMALLAAITMVMLGGAVFPLANLVLVESDSWLRVPATIVVAAGSIAFIAFVFLFPDGRFVLRWLRPLLAIWIGLNVISVFIPANSQLGSQGQLGFLAGLVYLLVGAGAQFVRYRRATDSVERQQLKWVAFGLGTAVVGLIVGAAFLPAIPHSVIANRQRFALVGMTFTSAMLLLIPLSIALALLRYRLWEVDRLARRAVISGALIAVVTGIYALIVLGASALIPGGSNRLWPLVAAVVVALLLQPVRARLERSVNRLFYGQRDDPYAVVSGLGERLEGSLTQETALPTVVETIATAMQLPYVAIALQRDGAFVLAAQQGEPGSESIVFPLTNGTEAIGQLIVSPRSEGEGFSEADRRLLADVARQAGAAVQAVRLTNELEQANRHLLSVRSEERQRLRRDLHDGLGPLLASQMLILDSARKVMPSDPALSGELLDQLHTSIQTSVEDVRRLVNSLRPAALDELGLLAAIQESTADLQRAGLRITVDAPVEPGPLSAASETAAYRIAMEAITNVVRHARARQCRVSLQVVPDHLLRIEIADDGVGIPKRASTGVGLDSIRERVRELEGTLEIDSSAGTGTTIVATDSHAGKTGMIPIRVLIADDHPMFRFGLRTVILAEPDFALVGEAENGRIAVEMTNERDPDVALLDLNMPELDGIAATARIARDAPRTGVLILTMMEDDETVLAAIRAGARGYIVKGSGGEEIVRAIRGVAAGEVIFGPSVGMKVLSALQTPAAPISERAFPELTRREFEVLQLLAQGQSNNAIADRLFLSEKTVRNHLSLIFDKLGVKSRAEAIVLAHRNGVE